MRLALDGLFTELRDVMNPSQRNLANISRRSIERIVALVENQLDLLQMMSGERSVCRRLVDLDSLLRTLPTRGFEDAADAPEDLVTILTRGGEGAAGPLYAFTDPDHLAAAIDCILGAGPLTSRRTIRLDYDDSLERCVIEVRVEFLTESDGTGVGESASASDMVPALDFEYRAYQTLLRRIGGDVAMEKNDDLKWVRIYLPRFPSFDRQSDFINPIHRVRAASGGNATLTNVHIVKCDLTESDGVDYLAGIDPAMRDFLMRASSVITGGDSIVMGKQHGSVYLVLVDRLQNELDHIVSFLGGAPHEPDNGRKKPYVWNPQTIVPDEREIDRLVGELELV
jgi:hypothetical protein